MQMGVVTMNKLEKAIITGTKLAQQQYEEMSGWWLSHGPESFIMCAVAAQLAKKNNFYVFIEASPEKIRIERGFPHRGRPDPDRRKRFDIVIWQKSKNDIRAIIEVKRAWNLGNLRKDREKISKYIVSKGFVKTGYLLAYTEAKGKRRKDTLNKRITHWASELKCQLAGSIMEWKGDGEWGWAACLLRFND